MDIVKKHLIIVICGGVALIALITLFFPLDGFYKTLQQTLDTRTTDYTKATQLLSTVRYLPVVGTNDKVEREKLPTFPSPKAISAGTLAKEQVTLASGNLLDQAVAMNRRELIQSPTFSNILPNPGDKIFQFRTTYLDAVRDGLPKYLNSAIPPTAEEIEAQAKQLHDSVYEIRVVKVDGKEMNRDQIEMEFKQAVDQLPEKLRQERAVKYRLYIDRTALSTNLTMQDSSKKPTATDVWFSQLAFWIESDVANAIATANERGGGDMKNILTDPVKRLVKLDIPQDISVYVMDAPAGAAPPGGPAPDQGGSVRNYSLSPTGRVCNSLYDVTHFTMVLEVDARQIPLILAELERGKLLTVTQVDLTPVDSAARFQEGFVYGNAPMVQMTLQCEALFMRKWTTLLMPEDVKSMLHVAPTPAAAAN